MSTVRVLCAITLAQPLSWKFIFFPLGKADKTGVLETLVIMNKHMCAWETADSGLCTLTLMFP